MAPRCTASSTTPIAVYLYAGDEIIENVTSGYFYYQDSLGNTSHVTDAAGNLLERYTYSAFGTPTFLPPNSDIARSTSALGIRHLFQGQLWTQETGLNDYRNRVELPAMGVFLQPDPIGFKGDAANIYRFCNNNAVNRIDPMGLYSALTSLGGGDWIKGSDGLSAWDWNHGMGSNRPQAGMDNGGGSPDGGWSKSISRENEGKKVVWKESGNWNDPNIEDHYADDSLSVNGRPAAAKTVHHLNVYDDGAKIIVDLKVDWWVRKSVHLRDANVAQLEQAHPNDWRKWEMKMRGHTDTFGTGTTANAVREFLDGTKTIGGVPLSRYQNEHTRQYNLYDRFKGGPHDYQM